MKAICRWTGTFSSGSLDFITSARGNSFAVLFGERRKMMEFYSMVGVFQKGGVFMYPILLAFAVGMAISFERWVELNRIRGANQKMWDVLHPVLASGEFDKAREMASKDKSSLAQMLGMGLARQGAVRRREDIAIVMEASMME